MKTATVGAVHQGDTTDLGLPTLLSGLVYTLLCHTESPGHQEAAWSLGLTSARGQAELPGDFLCLRISTVEFCVW